MAQANDIAVKDQGTPAPATDSAPVETAPAPEEDLDSFPLDESDFQDDDSNEEGQTGDEKPEKPKPDPAEPADDSAEDDQSAEDTDEIETPTDEKSETPEADKRKERLNTEIRDLVTQRAEIRREVEELNAKVYEARSQEQIMEDVNPKTGENYTALEAQLKEMQEKQELRDYNDKVAEAKLVINTESQRVLQDFPMFRAFKPGTETVGEDGNLTGEKNPDYQPGIAQRAARLLEQNYIRDPNTEQRDKEGNPIAGSGQITGTHLPIYELYNLIADASQLGANDGQLKGQQAAKKMMAAADNVPSAGPKSPKKDAFLEGFGDD